MARLIRGAKLSMPVGLLLLVGGGAAVALGERAVGVVLIVLAVGSVSVGCALLLWALGRVHAWSRDLQTQREKVKNHPPR